MNHVFRSRYGQVVLDGDSVYIHESLVYKTLLVLWRILSALAAPVLFIILLTDEAEQPVGKLRLLFWGLLSIVSLYRGYESFYKTSYVSKIHIHTIIEPPALEHRFRTTIVSLKLANGKTRQVTFLTRDQEHRRFADIISPYLASAQIA